MKRAALLVGGLFLGLALGVEFVRWPGPEAQEVEEPAEPKVSEAELELFIGVYTAMQVDHDLTIDAILAGRSVSLDTFRDIERRVQADQRMVDRARAALLSQAKMGSAWAYVAPTPTNLPHAAVPTPAATPVRPHKNRSR